VLHIVQEIKKKIYFTFGINVQNFNFSKEIEYILVINQLNFQVFGIQNK
jgi:hypothetical protein